MTVTANVAFPAKLECLFQPARYKVTHGGRGSAKSWSKARALLLKAAQQPLRILCTREIQKSIKDSVHKLLSDQIEAMGLGSFFAIFDTAIRGRNGSEFSFAGLASHTVESIKSYEGVDIVWVEEAQKVRKRSWDILIPTIRKPGSEIWISLNPELDTDETYKRFVLDPPPGAIVVQMNYMDNPWFPDVLEQERQHSKRTDPQNYDNIWEGKCKAAVDGAIYAAEVTQSQIAGRVTNVPYDPSLKVHVIWDLGWNDSMFLILAQRGLSDLRVIEAIEDDHRTLDWFSAELLKKNMNWGKLWLPHDGTHGNIQTGKSAQQTLQGLGWDVDITPNIPIARGIDQARSAFPRIWFDKTKADRLVQCLKRYRRAINAHTNEPGEPVHDEFSHGADCFRYFGIVADQLKNEEWGGDIVYPSLGIA